MIDNLYWRIVYRVKAHTLDRMFDIGDGRVNARVYIFVENNVWNRVNDRVWNNVRDTTMMRINGY